MNELSSKNYGRKLYLILLIKRKNTRLLKKSLSHFQQLVSNHVNSGGQKFHRLSLLASKWFCILSQCERDKVGKYPSLTRPIRLQDLVHPAVHSFAHWEKINWDTDCVDVFAIKITTNTEMTKRQVSFCKFVKGFWFKIDENWK